MTLKCVLVGCEENLPMAIKISLTFIAVLAEVSMKSKLLSSAYACASYRKKYSTATDKLTSSVTLFKKCIILY